MLENSVDTGAGLINPEDMDAIDTLMVNSAAATDAGDYRAALSGFSRALELSKQHFGETSVLTELENMIAGIKALLGE